MLKKLQKKIGVQFTDESLLTTALTHRSYLNEHKSTAEHNERLEYLGDAVLELVTTEHLYHSMPDTPEGRMTSIRAAIVRKENLARAASAIDLGTYLFLSKGEDQSGGRTNSYILANTVEALIGAVYLDSDYPTATKFIKQFILIYLDDIVNKQLFQDAKSLLQEKAQDKRKLTPTYKIIEEVGPDHDKIFTAAVFFDTDQQGQGAGQSKQSAELKAAEDALANLGW